MSVLANWRVRPYLKGARVENPQHLKGSLCLKVTKVGIINEEEEKRPKGSGNA